MNRSSSRAILRRRLMEPSADNWDDSDLNELLNQGALQAQKAIMEVSPLAFVAISDTDIIAGQEHYAKPSGMWHELALQRKNTTTNLYEPLGAPLEYELNRERAIVPGVNQPPSQPATGVVRYSHFGSYFALQPVPDALITDGLRVIFVPSIQFGVDHDSLPLPLGLHMLPVAWAHYFAIGETGEAAEGVERLIDRLTADIGKYYRETANRPPQLVPDLIKDYSGNS